MEIIKVLNVDNNTYYIKHLSIINELLPNQLSEKEIAVLSEFMALPSELTDENMFNSEARKRVRASLSLSPGGLGNHLKSMIDKKFLVKNAMTKIITMRDFLKPNTSEQIYKIKLIKNERTDS